MKIGVLLFLGFTMVANHALPHSITTGNIRQDSTKIWLKTLKSNPDLSISEKDTLLGKALLNQQKQNPAKLYNISAAALASGDSILFRKYNAQVITLAKAANAPKAHIFALWDLADFFREARPDSSFYHYQKAYNVAITLKEDPDNRHYAGLLLNNIGILQDNIKDYVGAEKSHIKAINYFEEVDREDKLYTAYNSLGIAQNGLRKFKKAVEYYERARSYIPLNPEERQNRLYNQNENNIASAYLRSSDYDRAFKLFSELLQKQGFKSENPLLYAKVISSRAYSGFRAGNLSNEKAKAALVQSNMLLDSIPNEYDKARNYEFLAQVLAAETDTAMAIQQALLAKNLAQNTNNNDRLLSSLKLLTTLDGENSAVYAKDYFELNEELQQKEREIQDKFARIRMETDEILEQNETLSKQRTFYARVIFGLLFFGAAIVIIVSQRIKNQRLRYKQKEQQNNQEIYDLMLNQHGKLEEGKKSEQKRVSEELHDGILGQMLGIRLIMSGLNDRTDDSAIAQRAELIGKMQELEEEVRTISHELNASAYEKVNNFIISMQDLIHTVSGASHINIDFEYPKQYHWDGLSGEVKINTYRIVQECLQNCVKHARCNQINILFQITKKTLNLDIVDNGIGFDTRKGKKGIGVKNITSRVKKLGGTLTLESEINKGSHIKVNIPLAEELKSDARPEERIQKSIQEV